MIRKGGECTEHLWNLLVGNYKIYVVNSHEKGIKCCPDLLGITQKFYRTLTMEALKRIISFRH